VLCDGKNVMASEMNSRDELKWIQYK
jgi:hypothetical protein